MTQAAHIVEFFYEENHFHETSPNQVSSQLHSILQNYEIIKSSQENQLQSLKTLLSQGSNYIQKIKQNQSRFIQSLALQVTQIMSSKIQAHAGPQLQQYISNDFYNDVESVAKRLHQNCTDSAEKETNKLNELIKQKITTLENFVKQHKKDELEMKNLIFKLEEFSRQNVIEIPVEMDVPKEIYEVPIEMHIEEDRDFYEIPVEMDLHKQSCDISIQTDDLGASEIRIVEVPVEVKVVESDMLILNSRNYKQVNEVMTQFESSRVQVQNQYEILPQMNSLKNTTQSSIDAVNILKQKLLDMSVAQNSSQVNLQAVKLVESQIKEVRQQIKYIEVPIIVEVEKIVEVPCEVIVQKIFEVPVYIGQCEEIFEKKVKTLKKKEAKPAKASRLSHGSSTKDSSLNSYVQGLIDLRMGPQTSYQRLHGRKEQQEYEEVEQTVYETRKVDFSQENCPFDHKPKTVYVEVPILQEKIVQKIHTIIDVPSVQERVIEVPIFQERIVEVPVIQERIIQVPMIEEKIIQKIVQVPVIIQKLVYQPIHVPVVSTTYKDQLNLLENSNNNLHISQTKVNNQEQVVILQSGFDQEIYNQSNQTQQKIKHPIILESCQVSKSAEKQIHQVPEGIVEKGVIFQQIVQKIVQVPVEIQRYIEVEVPVEIERIVQKIIQRQVEVPIFIEKIVYVEVPVEIQKIIEKIIEVPILVEKEVELPVEIEKIIEKRSQKIVQVPIMMEKIVYVEVPVEIQKIIEKTIETPVIIQKIVEVEVPVEIIAENKSNAARDIIEVPVEVIISKQIEVPVVIKEIVEVPIELIVQKKVEVPVIIKEIIQVPIEVIIQKIIEKPVIIEKIIQVPIIEQRIVEVPIIQEQNQTQSKRSYFSSSDEPVLLQISPVQPDREQILLEEVTLQVSPTEENMVKLQAGRPSYQNRQGNFMSYDQFDPNFNERQTIQVPFEVLVQKIVQVPVVIEKIIQVPIVTDQIIKVEIPVEIEKIVQVERIVYIERIIEVPIEVFIDRQVPVEIIIERKVQVPIEVFIDRQVPVEVTVVRVVQVPIEVIVEKQRIVETPVIIRQVIEVPIEVIVERQVEVPVIIEKIVRQYVEIPCEVIVEKIVETFAVINDINLLSTSIINENLVESMPENDKFAPFLKSSQAQIKVQEFTTVQDGTNQNNQQENQENLIRLEENNAETYEQQLQEVNKVQAYPDFYEMNYAEKHVIEVPTEIYIEKIVEKSVEVIVQKNVEVIKEVPIEIYVEKIVEVPVQVIVEKEKEVPVSIYVETITEIPVQIIVEKTKQVPVQIFVEKITLVPVEIIVQKFTQVPVEIIVQKFTQVPVEIIVQKFMQIPIQIYIEKIKQVPVQIRSIIQVPVEVIVSRIVEVPVSIQTKVQVPVETIVERIVQVPVQVLVDVEKIIEVVVKEFIEVPVQIFIQRTVQTIIQKIVYIERPTMDRHQSIEGSYEEQNNLVKLQQQAPLQPYQQQQNLVSLQNANCHPQTLTQTKDLQNFNQSATVFSQVQKFIQVPVQIYIEKIIQVPHVQQRIIELVRYVDRYVDREVPVVQEKIIEVEKIVEVPIQVILEKYVQVIVESIVEVPVQVFIDREVIVEKIVEVIVERPVEVIVEKIVEIVVERVMEVPVEVYVDTTPQSAKLTSYEHENILNLEQSPDQYGHEDEELLLLQNGNIFNDYKQEILEIPVQVQTIVEKIIEVPVEIQKIVQRIIQVPVIIQKIVQRIVEVPVYVLREQNQQGIEVPVEIQKVIQKIIQVPVQIEKYIQVPVIIEQRVQVPVYRTSVQRQIIQIPVQIQKIIYVDRVVYQKVFIQVPVQVIVEKIIQVPVTMDSSKPFNYFSSNMINTAHDQNYFSSDQQIQTPLMLQAGSPSKNNEQISISRELEEGNAGIETDAIIQGAYFIEIPIEVVVEKIVEVPVEIIVERTIEVPVEIEKIVEVRVEIEKIVEVPVEIIVERFIQVPVSTVKEIQKRVEIPVEIEKTQEVPVEIIQSGNTIEVPVETIVEIPIEIPIEIERIVEVPVEIIVEKHVQVPVEIITEKIVTVTVEVPVEIIVEKIVQVPVQIQKIVEKLVEVPIFIEKSVEVPIIIEDASQNNSQRYSYEKIHSYIDSSLDKVSSEERDMILGYLREKYSCFFDQERVFYEIPVELHVEEMQQSPVEQQKAIYEIPVQIHLAPEQSQGLLLENSNQDSIELRDEDFTPNIQQPIKLQTGLRKNIEEILIIQGDSITHNDQDLELAQQLQGSLQQQQFDNQGNPIPNIQIMINRENDSSLGSDDKEFHKEMKNLELSKIDQKNEASEEQNLFGSINAFMGRQDYGLSPRIHLDMRADTSSFDCGDYTGKEMKIDNSHYLDPKHVHGIMPILPENSEEISASNDNLSGIRENIIIDDHHYEEIEKLRNQLNYLHEDNESNKKQLLELSIKNHQLQADLQNKNLEVECLASRILTFSMQKENEILTFKSQKNQVQEFVQKLQSQNEQLIRRVEQTKNKYLRLQEKHETTVTQLNELKVKYTSEIEIMTTELYEKKTLLKEIKTEQHEIKNFYENELSVITEELKSFKNQIHKLQEEINKKQALIQKLNESHEQLRIKLCQTIAGKSSPETTTTYMYEQQFMRIKENFELQGKEKEQKIIELTFIIQNLEQDLQRQAKNMKQVQEQLIASEKYNEQLLMINEKQKMENELKLYQLQTKLNEVVSLIKQENYDLKDRNNEKSIIIQKLRRQVLQFGNRQQLLYSSGAPSDSIKQKVPPTSKKQSEISGLSSAAIKIEHISTPLKSQRHNQNNALYIQTLQGTVLRYESIISGHQQMISELQQRVYEYLKDALEKEQQAESLYTKLYEYQNTINSILVEKITMELQNKRLKRVIVQAEKKLELLGNQLIRVARESIEYRGEEEEDYFDQEEEEEEADGEE